MFRISITKMISLINDPGMSKVAITIMITTTIPIIKEMTKITNTKDFRENRIRTEKTIRIFRTTENNETQEISKIGGIRYREEIKTSFIIRFNNNPNNNHFSTNININSINMVIFKAISMLEKMIWITIIKTILIKSIVLTVITVIKAFLYPRINPRLY